MATKTPGLEIIPYHDLRDEDLVGAGGFGKVFKAKHSTRGTVAVKKLLTTLVDDVYKEKLQREARTQAQLKHPNIATVYGVLWEPGQYGIVMEHAEHGSLDIFLQKYAGSALLPWKLGALGDVIIGMTYLHSQHIIHRDLKSQNLLVTADLRIKICDFGLAEWRTYSRTHTSYRTGAGTLTHIAPEHLKNLNYKANHKTDVYSFAIVVWEVLSEKLPFSGVLNDTLLMKQVTGGQRPDMHQIETDVQKHTVWMTEQMMKCWSDQPHDRPSFKEVKAVYEREMETKEQLVKQAKVQMLQVTQVQTPQTAATAQATYSATELKQPARPLQVPDRGDHGDRGVQQPDDPDSGPSTLVEDGSITPASVSSELKYPVMRETTTDPSTTDTSNLFFQRQPTDGSTAGPSSVSSAGPPSVNLTASLQSTEEPTLEEDADPSDEQSLHQSQQSIAEYSLQHQAAGGVSPQHQAAGGVSLQHHANGGVTVQHPASGGVTVQHPAPGGVTVQQRAPGGVTVQHQAAGGVTVQHQAAGGVTVHAGGVTVQHQPAASGSTTANSAKHAGKQKDSTARGPTSATTTGRNVQTFVGTAGCDETSVHNRVGGNMTNVQIGTNNVMHIHDGTRAKPKTSKSTKPPDKKKKIIVPSRGLEEDDMDFVAKHIGAPWQQLGRKLGFSQGELDIIRVNNHVEGLHEMIFRMIHQWCEKEDQKATLKNLAKALCEVDLAQVAFKIEEREKTRKQK